MQFTFNITFIITGKVLALNVISKTFPEFSKIPKLFRDGYPQINRNIHPCLSFHSKKHYLCAFMGQFHSQNKIF